MQGLKSFLLTLRQNTLIAIGFAGLVAFILGGIIICIFLYSPRWMEFGGACMFWGIMVTLFSFFLDIFFTLSRKNGDKK